MSEAEPAAINAGEEITKNTVVAFHYSLTDGEGKKLESSDAGEPVVYLHGGYRNLLPKLEQAFDGKKKGEKFVVTLEPKDAYGMRTEKPTQRIPIKHLITKAKRYTPGMTVKVNTGEGQRDVVITKVGKFNVDVDTNHPLAGVTVIFDIVIHDIRPATDDELSHGHSHGWDASHAHH